MRGPDSDEGRGGLLAGDSKYLTSESEDLMPLRDEGALTVIDFDFIPDAGDVGSLLRDFSHFR